MTAFNVSTLQPGDVLLYTGSGLIQRAIRRKTNADAIFGSRKGPSHVEIYVGEGRSFAARNFIGVGFYPLRTNGLVGVLRPVADTPDGRLDWSRARAAMQAMVGQGYDFGAIASFFRLGANRDDLDHEQICSEAVTRVLRSLGVEPFYEDLPAAAVTPVLLWISSRLRRVWKVDADLTPSVSATGVVILTGLLAGLWWATVHAEAPGVEECPPPGFVLSTGELQTFDWRISDGYVHIGSSVVILHPENPNRHHAIALSGKTVDLVIRPVQSREPLRKLER